jgi:hypothetical protein
MKIDIYIKNANGYICSNGISYFSCLNVKPSSALMHQSKGFLISKLQNVIKNEMIFIVNVVFIIDIYFHNSLVKNI